MLYNRIQIETLPSGWRHFYFHLMLILRQPTQYQHSLHENKSVSNRWAEFRSKYGNITTNITTYNYNKHD